MQAACGAATRPSVSGPASSSTQSQNPRAIPTAHGDIPFTQTVFPPPELCYASSSSTPAQSEVLAALDDLRSYTVGGFDKLQAIANGHTAILQTLAGMVVDLRKDADRQAHTTRYLVERMEKSDSHFAVSGAVVDAQLARIEAVLADSKARMMVSEHDDTSSPSAYINRAIETEPQGDQQPITRDLVDCGTDPIVPADVEGMRDRGPASPPPPSVSADRTFVDASVDASTREVAEAEVGACLEDPSSPAVPRRGGTDACGEPSSPCFLGSTFLQSPQQSLSNMGLRAFGVELQSRFASSPCVMEPLAPASWTPDDDSSDGSLRNGGVDDLLLDSFLQKSSPTRHATTPPSSRGVSYSPRSPPRRLLSRHSAGSRSLFGDRLGSEPMDLSVSPTVRPTSTEQSSPRTPRTSSTFQQRGSTPPSPMSTPINAAIAAPKHTSQSEAVSSTVVQSPNMSELSSIPDRSLENVSPSTSIRTPHNLPLPRNLLSAHRSPTNISPAQSVLSALTPLVSPAPSSSNSTNRPIVIKIGSSVPTPEVECISLSMLNRHQDDNVRPRKRRKTDLGVGTGSSKSTRGRGRKRGGLGRGMEMGKRPRVRPPASKWPKITNASEREFVQCDNCKEWYHIKCVGLKTGDPCLQTDDPYYCPPCMKSE
ncbi:hypothetical protein CERSUDRAFT_96549 [Gelatoporia subvermispora B]|uniref:Zinc finger PHD-type domain-containing protein n=1 Tax=Ceriporiopsis subvermispora (strain B) TaxID=914234 RepID=M2QEG9_CERS8|nr:hypothetical protein CERSUDRAFT_96549 [Gelatoporia subvermispora B]